jgi:alpha-beta hydrolase superfamily lysophospholipase
MIKAIEKAGGKKAKLTLYPGVGHNSWSRAYANEEVYKWLLSHKTSGSTKK